MLNTLGRIGKAHVHVEFRPGRQEMVINTVHRRGAKVTEKLTLPAVELVTVWRNENIAQKLQVEKQKK